MVKKKRLLHIITGLDRGGAEAVLFQLLQSLDRDYFEHVVIYFHSGYYLEKIQELGIQTYQIKGLLLPYDPVFVYRLFSLVKKIKPDCLHTLLWAANFLGRMLASWYRIPHVQALHNTIHHNGIVRNFLDRITARKKGSLVAVSDTVAHSIHTDAFWFADEKIVVIKNGIVPSVLIKDIEHMSKDELGLSEAHFVIGSVGRFEWVKNHSLLLTAFALLYDMHAQARLVLVGAGSQEYYLRQRAYDLGVEDRVIFVIGQDARRYYKAFDCFVMSSHREGLSIALLEAMGSGVMPIIIALEKKHEVIEHMKNGLLVYENDAQKLADSIEVAMRSKELRYKLGEQAQKTVSEHFTAHSMIRKYDALYRSII